MSEKQRRMGKQSAAVAAAAVIAWLLGEFAGVDVPPGIEGSLGVLFGAGAKIVGDKL